MRRFLPLLGFLVLVHAAGCGPAGPSRPNVILLVVDTLRADHLGFQGFAGSISPNLDRLAEESIVFRNHFAQSPWTKPSMATLFTSLYPQAHGLTNHEGKYWGEGTPGLHAGILADQAVTLAERLQESGYATAGFVTNPWLIDDYGFGQGFDHYDDDHARLTTPASRVVDLAREWLAARDSDAPYFLYLHFMDVHAPYSAPRSDFEMLRESAGRDAERRISVAERPDNRWNNIEVRDAWVTEEMRHELSYWRTRYASGVRFFDRQLAPFLQELRASGDLDRSLLVVTSDHGEELFEHGDWSHGQNLYDHQLHIPLLIRNPRGRQGGTSVSHVFEQVDLMPTLLSVAGVSPVERAQGRDLAALLQGSSMKDSGMTFATATQRTPGLYSVRTPEHKLLYDVYEQASWLFDLTQDPAEQHDVAADRREIAARLRSTLLEHIDRTTAGGTLEGGTAEIPEDLEERLRSLGYVE